MCYQRAVKYSHQSLLKSEKKLEDDEDGTHVGIAMLSAFTVIITVTIGFRKEEETEKTVSLVDTESQQRPSKVSLAGKLKRIGNSIPRFLSRKGRRNDYRRVPLYEV